jgi:RNA polymerase sigma factor (TIGR02999 family)
MDSAHSLTGQLRLYSTGSKDGEDSLIREILPRLRQIAAGRLLRERHAPFTPTELIGETWLTRLQRGGWRLESREHFFRIASRAMKNVLTDSARKHLSQMRGSGAIHFSFEEVAQAPPAAVPSVDEVLSIAMLLDRLEKENPKVAMVVHLHYIVGFGLDEIAAETGLTIRQVRYRWNKGKVWLATQFHARKR